MYSKVQIWSSMVPRGHPCFGCLHILLVRFLPYLHNSVSLSFPEGKVSVLLLWLHFHILVTPSWAFSLSLKSESVSILTVLVSSLAFILGFLCLSRHWGIIYWTHSLQGLNIGNIFFLNASPINWCDFIVYSSYSFCYSTHYFLNLQIKFG